MSDKFKYIMKWTPGYSDMSLYVEALTKKLSEFTLWRDSEAKFVNHSDYLKMVQDGLIDPKEYVEKYSWDNWAKRDRPNTQAMVCITEYATQWQVTWDMLSMTKSDWCDGWFESQKLTKALEVKLQVYLDWDTAINEYKVEMKKRRKAYLALWREAIECDYYK